MVFVAHKFELKVLQMVSSNISPRVLSICLPETGVAYILEGFSAVVVLPLKSCTHAARAQVGFPFHFLMSFLWSCK